MKKNLSLIACRLSLSHGFSLFELLMAMAIIMLVGGTLLSTYDKFDKSQKVKQAAATFRNNLRLAQTKALSGQKPESGCSQLSGYSITFTGTTYTTQARCTEGLVGTASTVSLPSGVTFSPVPTELLFRVLTQGVDTAVTISLTGFAKTVQIVISVSGDINEL